MRRGASSRPGVFAGVSTYHLGMRWFLLLIITLAAVEYWRWTLAIVGIGGTYIGLLCWYEYRQEKKAAERAAERQRIATLIEHADREHRLVQQGNVDGIYGAYPVPDECRGLGVWLCDSERPRHEDGAVA